MKEHHLHVRRTARYYTLGDAAADEVWVVCHGYAQLARYFLRPFAGIDDGSRLIVAPEALNRYYSETSPGVHGADARISATWMTREDRELEIGDYIAYLDQLVEAVAVPVPRRLVALGFSQGAATVSRWAAAGSAEIEHVVLWGSSLAHEQSPAPDLLRGARVTIAAGDADPYFTIETAEAQQQRMHAAGMDCEVFRYSGGHRIENNAIAALAASLTR